MPAEQNFPPDPAAAFLDREPLAALAAAHLPEGRRAALLPPPIVDELVRQRLFRLWIPRRYGGLEATLPEALAVYDALARIDGALGWAAMIGAGGGLFAAFLPPARAQQAFGPANAVVAGSGAVGGVATPVEGGYRVRGRWRHASGAHYATLFTANCRIVHAGAAAGGAHRGRARTGDAATTVRAMAFPPADVRIVESWRASGLRATGTHDIEVDDAFVPLDATFSLAEPPVDPGTLYRIPFGVLTELPVSAVALGLARRAIDEFEALAAGKPGFGRGAVPDERAPGTVPEVGCMLGESRFVREAIENARRQVEFAAQALHGLAARIWDETRETGATSSRHTAACTATCVRWVRDLVGTVAALVPLAGMNAIDEDDAFAIAWRDLEATAAHRAVSPLAV
jgi:alkylation response protein AidB-like acyl-CoA dehydrogenase